MEPTPQQPPPIHPGAAGVSLRPLDGGSFSGSRAAVSFPNADRWAASRPRSASRWWAWLRFFAAVFTAYLCACIIERSIDMRPSASLVLHAMFGVCLFGSGFLAALVIRTGSTISLVKTFFLSWLAVFVGYSTFLYSKGADELNIPFALIFSVFTLPALLVWVFALAILRWFRMHRASPGATLRG